MMNMPKQVLSLSYDEVLGLVRNAKLVAIRWDLIPWCLVLDLDAPTSEAKGAQMRRVWLVFEGMSEISWLLDRARLPNGCWISNSLETESLSDGFFLFTFMTLAPAFTGAGSVDKNPTRVLCIRAKKVYGIASESSGMPDVSGLTRDVRLGLAGDEEMLLAASGRVGATHPRGFLEDQP
jgi:hypothetical protein